MTGNRDYQDEKYEDQCGFCGHLEDDHRMRDDGSGWCRKYVDDGDRGTQCMCDGFSIGMQHDGFAPFRGRNLKQKVEQQRLARITPIEWRRRAQAAESLVAARDSEITGLRVAVDGFREATLHLWALALGKVADAAIVAHQQFTADQLHSWTVQSINRLADDRDAWKAKAEALEAELKRINDRYPGPV